MNKSNNLRNLYEGYEQENCIQMFFGYDIYINEMQWESEYTTLFDSN